MCSILFLSMFILLSTYVRNVYSVYITVLVYFTSYFCAFASLHMCDYTKCATKSNSLIAFAPTRLVAFDIRFSILLLSLVGIDRFA